MLNFTDNWDKMEEPTYFDTLSKNDQIEFDVPQLINDIIMPDLTKELKDMLIKKRRVYDDSDRKAFDYSYGKQKANKELNDWWTKKEQQIKNIISQNKINGEHILKELQIVFNSKKSSPVFNSIFDLSESDISLLPLISWLRNHDNKERKNFSFYYKEALSICQNLGGNL